MVSASAKKFLCLILLLCTLTAISVHQLYGSTNVVRVPSNEVYSWQPVIILAKANGGSVELEVNITLKAYREGVVELLPKLSFLRRVPMLRLASNPEWYIAFIPGLPAFHRQRTRLLRTVELNVSSHVAYRVIVNGREVGGGEYEVKAKEVTAKNLKPLILVCVEGIDRELMEETLGLGPKWWTWRSNEPLKVIIVAMDVGENSGIREVKFEYRVNGGAWQSVVLEDHQAASRLRELVDRINGWLAKVEERLDLDLPEVDLPAQVKVGEIPGQSTGSYVEFKASAVDVDGNRACSPKGLYYVVNRGSDVKILVVDPHVKLWVLSESLRQLHDSLLTHESYGLRQALHNGLPLLEESLKIADAFNKYRLEHFHHWEYLGGRYDLYIVEPRKLKDALDALQPDVIILSNLWLGANETGWTWDLRDLGVLDDLIDYVKSRHAGLIATYGTLSDFKVWSGCEESQHHKVCSRGHVGESLEDFDPVHEKTVAGLLGLPHLALWEYARDKAAQMLCADPQTQRLGLLLGSMPLQVRHVPFDGILKATPDAEAVGFQLPAPEFKVEIPGYHELTGYKACTQIGWQLGLPCKVALNAWREAGKVREKARALHERVSTLVESITGHKREIARHVSRSLRGLGQLYRSLVRANITRGTIKVAINLPELGISRELPPLSVQLSKVARLMPVKVVALSRRGLAGILVYDKWWDKGGYRSVYFSFEVEASTCPAAKQLLVEAVKWVRGWHYREPKFLGSMPVPAKLAERFRQACAGVPIGTGENLIMTEEGYSLVSFKANDAGTYRVVVAHPTTERVEFKLFNEGDVEELSSKTDERITLIILRVREPCNVNLGLQAKSDSSLNPAYVEVYYEAAPSVVKKASNITCDVDRSSLTLGEEVKVEGAIIPARGDVEVTLTYTAPNGSLIIRHVSTSSEGRFLDRFRPDSVGTWKVQASWPGDEEYEGAASDVISFTVAPPSAFTTFNEREPNGRPEAANIIGELPGSIQIQGSISPLKDIDYFKFTCVAACSISIRAQYSGGELVLELLDARYNVIKWVLGKGAEVCIEADLAKGIYYIRVRDDWGDDVIESYTIMILTPSYQEAVTKKASSITCNVDRTSITLNERVRVYGYISPPRAGVKVTLVYRAPDGGVVTRYAYTSSEGRYVDFFRPDRVGSWRVQAYWLGDEEYEGAYSDVVYFDVNKIPTTITLSVEQKEVDVGSVVMVEGSITPSVRAPIKITVKKPDGTVQVKYVTSDVDGSFSLQVKLDREGEWTFIASWEGDPIHAASASPPITVEAKPKRCLVATAAYGTELAGPVAFLRSFRDDIVMKTRAGKCFMESFNVWYYAWAPYVAQAEWSCEPLRHAVKYALYPLIGVLHVASAAYQPLSFSPEAGVIVAGLVASALIAIVYLTPITIASALLTRRAPSPKATKLATATWSASLIATCLGDMAKASSALLISTPALVLSTMALTSILITKLAAKR